MATVGATYQNTRPQVIVLGFFNLESLVETILFVVGLRRVVAVWRRSSVSWLLIALLVALLEVLLWRGRLLLILSLIVAVIVALIPALLVVVSVVGLLLLILAVLLRWRPAPVGVVVAVVLTHGGQCQVKVESRVEMRASRSAAMDDRSIRRLGKVNNRSRRWCFEGGRRKKGSSARGEQEELGAAEAVLECQGPA